MDHLAAANWMFACVNTGEDDDSPEPPTPVPRPGGADEDEQSEESGDGEDRGGRTRPAEEGEALSPHTLARFFG